MSDLTAKTIAELRDGFRAATSRRARSPRLQRRGRRRAGAQRLYGRDAGDALAAADAADRGAKAGG